MKMRLTFHHIGIACLDLEKTASSIVGMLGASEDSGKVFDPNQNASVRLLKIDEHLQIELVSGPVVEGVLRANGTYYHVCFQTPVLEEAIAGLQACGMLVVSPPKEAVLFSNRRVAFLFGPFGLVELLESA